MALHVRTADDPAAMLAAVRREVRALDASLPLFDVRTLEEQKSGSLNTSRMAATLLTVFGLLALLLAAMGLYGVMAYAVNRRTREIGIRVALGAQGHEVRRLIMAEGMTTVAIGLVLGVAGALAASRLVASFLYGVTSTDPIAFAGAAVLLAVVAWLANYLPGPSFANRPDDRAQRLKPTGESAGPIGNAAPGSHPCGTDASVCPSSETRASGAPVVSSGCIIKLTPLCWAPYEL